MIQMLDTFISKSLVSEKKIDIEILNLDQLSIFFYYELQKL